MLAEPRTKRSYTLVPKGKPLYEDETRFGTKLMQKMGWSKGKGLGRDESGAQDFLRVRYKNDAKGLGFEARDDQWTQHEQSFNGLLSTLNGKEEDENDSVPNVNQATSGESEDEAPRMGFGFQDTTDKEKAKPNVEKVAKLKEKISGISLEEKSKQSRARVHYQKFTRGKDLSQYSEKDLANIFGKRVDEESQKANSEKEGQDSKTINEQNNVHFLRSDISVSDYFKMKMQAKRNQLENGNKTNVLEANECIENSYATEDVQQIEKVPKKKKKKQKEKYNELEDTLIEEQLEQKVVTKKEKKNKHKDLESESAIENENQFTQFEVDDAQEQKQKKKKKKSKNKTQEHLQEVQSDKEQEVNVEQKKRKHDCLENEEKKSTESITENEFADEPRKKKQKKNKKDKDEIKDDVMTTETQITPADQLTLSKKKTKNKNESADHHEVPEIPSKKSNTNKTKDVSCNANDVYTKDANSQKLKFLDIENLYNSYNIYSISSFCAEKFRNLNFNNFNGSTLSQIEGYGLSKDIQLEVHVDQNDEERITNLWKSVLDKYDNLEKPKKTYYKYIKDVKKAHKMKQKMPKLYIKTWKRKNAFQIV